MDPKSTTSIFENKDAVEAARISLVVSFVVLALKVAGFVQTSSTAILSDALETIVNVIAALGALSVMKIVSKPADESHPYGHGKAEYFSAAFEGGLVFFAAGFIVFDSVRAFFHPRETKDLFIGIGWIGAATIINLIAGLFLLKHSKAHQSIALKASAMHLFSDVKTTVAVILGLLLVYLTKIPQLDAIIAFGVGIHLLIESYTMVRSSVGGLTDEIDVDSLKSLTECFDQCRMEGIIDIHKLKAIRSGRFHHIDAHLVVPEYWNIQEVHQLAHDFESAVVQLYPYDGEIAFHVDPCMRKYCDGCAVVECPVRTKPMVQVKKFSLNHLLRPADEAT